MNDENNYNNKVKPVTLRSEKYNHNIEKIVRRDNDTEEKIKWVFAIGVGLIILLLVILIIFIK